MHLGFIPSPLNEILINLLDHVKDVTWLQNVENIHKKYVAPIFKISFDTIQHTTFKSTNRFIALLAE